MGTKHITVSLQAICRWSFQHNNIARRATHAGVESRNHANDFRPDLADLMEEKLNTDLPTQTTNGSASIYRVPNPLRSVEPKAYEPNIVSVGPYHHGASHLQAMEITKWNFFHRLFNPNNPNRPNLNALVNELKEMEQKARFCYSEDLKINSTSFINMMLVDSCFVVELLRETREIDFKSKSIPMIRRWMLPLLRRDLIMLENQLPMFVLSKVYALTSSSTELGLKEHVLRFFEPLIYKDLDTPKDNITLGEEEDGASHFLELFRASICPSEVSEKKFPFKEPHMFRSVTDLKEAGVKLKKGEKYQPLDVRFKKGVLKLAPVSMDDYRFTLFRNMVAFEQCHFGCKPYVTAYIFFLDRLVNSAEDIELLHYAGVMQHTLGGNKNAARLVNKLCKEVAGAVDDSYLHNVVWKINCYCNNGWNLKRAKLKHEYFYNIWVSLSTLAAILIIYFTIIQTISGLGDENERAHMFGTGFWISIAEAFSVPFRGAKPSKNSYVPLKDKLEVEKCFRWLLRLDLPDEQRPLFFMSC